MLQVKTDQGHQASFILHLEDNHRDLVPCTVQLAGPGSCPPGVICTIKYKGQVVVHQVPCVQYSYLGQVMVHQVSYVQ